MQDDRNLFEPGPEPDDEPRLVSPENCPSCGSTLNEDEQFCHSCGQRQEKVPPTPRRCPECSTIVGDTEVFCPDCGLKVGSIFVAPARCPECRARLEEDAVFCYGCGFKLEKVRKRRRKERRGLTAARRWAKDSHRKSVNRARTIMLVISILSCLLALLCLVGALAQGPDTTPEFQKSMWMAFAMMLVLAGGFFACFIWARSSPVPATITALTLNITVSVPFLIILVFLPCALVVQIIFILLMIYGVRSAVAYNKIMQQEAQRRKMLRAPVEPPAEPVEDITSEVPDDAPVGVLPFVRSRIPKCPRCFTETKAKAKFCPNCGMSLTSGSPRRRTWTEVRHAASMGHISGVREWADIKKVIILYAAMLSAAVLTGIIWGGSFSHHFVHNIVFMAVVLTAYFFALDMLKRPFSTFGFPLWAYLPVAAGCIVTFLIMVGFQFSLMSLFGLEKPEIGMLDNFKKLGFGLPVAILTIAVFPGIFEEIAFRGVIQGTLEKHMTPTITILLSGLTFGIIHVQFLNFPLILLGVYFAWLRHKSGSIYPCILAHFGHNCTVVLAEWYGRF